MQTRITARHFTAPDELKDFAAKRMSKLERYFDGITDVYLELTKTEHTLDNKRAELSVNVYRQTLKAVADADQHETAINECISQVSRQLKRYKDKLRDKHRDHIRAEAKRSITSLNSPEEEAA